MKKLCLLFVFYNTLIWSQVTLVPLTIDKIMRDPKWIGSSPTGVQWNPNSKVIYFKWNPEKAESDSMYQFILGQSKPTKLNGAQRINLLAYDDVVFSKDHSMWVYSFNNNIYFQTKDQSFPKPITKTDESEHNPVFSFQETAIVYKKGDNLFAWNIADGSTTQVIRFERNSPPILGKKENEQDTWLRSDQLREFEVLSNRKMKKDLSDSLGRLNQLLYGPKMLKPVYVDDKIITGQQISPDGRYITFKLISSTRGKTTIVPNYVTESGYTDPITARSKVGSAESPQQLMIYDRQLDSVYPAAVKTLPGIKDVPSYYKDYPEVYARKNKDSTVRSLTFLPIDFAPFTSRAVIDVRSIDNKDRWLCALNLATGDLQVIDRQHNDAWIGGPGIGSRFGGAAAGWMDEERYWYQSEVTGYSHLYVYSFSRQKPTALTQGNYEIQRAQLSADKKTFYISSNQVHPGEQQFYHLNIESGSTTRITSMIGAHQVTISPDEKTIAYLYSYSNKPWELYIQDNRAGSIPHKITDEASSAEFKSYLWQDPEITTFTAQDGATVYARIYKPNKKVMNKAAILFVHGAGYLQNAHRWWSSYFREYMFHNLLSDLGYTVMDIDYRGSAGYGSAWRTGIYRHMGGKDLTDHVDAAKYLVDRYGIQAQKIGIYGGSYGGFITLMGLFTTPNVFAAGAALRPVTDWAHYNHPYTSNILNEPFTDSIAYKKSSPLYYANGLKKPLLICHGMVDVNVHYQDVVLLTQRLIELKKDNWELASYPMEDHGFVEPSSWTDEYKRILKLFQQWLK